RFFEDFNVGDVYRCRLGRTVTEADNIWFTLLTSNTNQINFNKDFARRTEFGKCLINSTLTLAIVTGMGVADVSENGVALGWDESSCPIRSSPATRSTPSRACWRSASPGRTPSAGSSRSARAASSRRARWSSTTSGACWCGRRPTRRAGTSSPKSTNDPAGLRARFDPEVVVATALRRVREGAAADPQQIDLAEDPVAHARHRSQGREVVRLHVGDQSLLAFQGECPQRPAHAHGVQAQSPVGRYRVALVHVGVAGIEMEHEVLIDRARQVGVPAIGCERVAIEERIATIAAEAGLSQEGRRQLVGIPVPPGELAHRDESSVEPRPHEE